MNQIKFNVVGNHLELTEDAVTTEGCVNYDKCVFSFDNEWSDLEKTAVFACGNSDTFRVAINNSECFIPAQCLEKDGIIRIGVYGISSEDVIIATNSVAHKVVDGIEEIGEWVEEDFSLVGNALAQLKAYNEEYQNTLDKKFDSLLKQLEESTNLPQTSATSLFLDDWYKPEAFTDTENCPIISKGATYQDYLNYMIEPLLTAYPDYVSKKEIGTDSSGTYKIYTYTFSPDNYEKTVLLTTFTHGIERTAFYALGYFLDRLCRKAYCNSTLNYIKSKIKLVVVPVVNPYALVNATSYNANHVNIGYNYPYNWESCSSSYKGSQGADQQETKNIISLLTELSADKLCAVVDLHNSTTTVSGKTIFYPRFKRNCISELSRLVNSMNVNSYDQAATSILAASNSPTLSNYASDRFDVNSCEIVWASTIYGGIYDNDNISAFTEFISNTVFTMSKYSPYPCNQIPSPFVKHYSWTKSSETDVFNIPKDILTDMRISACKMSLTSPYIISMNGYVNINVSQECTLTIKPLLSQVNSPEQEYSDVKSSTAFTHELTLSVGTHIIPVSSVLQAYFTSYNNSSDNYFCEDVEFVLSFSSTLSNAASVCSYSLTFNATPSNAAHPVEISCPMGNVSDFSSGDIPTQSLIYPLGTFVSNDNHFDD